MLSSLIQRIAICNRRLFSDDCMPSNWIRSFEPDYLDSNKLTIPHYEQINVQLKGYDYPILESYHRLVHKIAINMGLEVEDSYAMPLKKFKIKRFKPFSTVMESEFELNIYERDVQLMNVPAIECPLFIRTLESALPSGVTLNVDIFDPAEKSKRYIPDKELMDLKEELENVTQKKS